MKDMASLTGVEISMFLMLTVLVVVLLFMLLLIYNVTNIIYRQQLEHEGKNPSAYASLLGDMWNKFYDNQTQAVPIEAERSILMDHNYDGIQELDNHLPPWWKNLFYATIIFGVVYLGVYHVYAFFPLSKAEYKEELAQAAVDVAAFEAKGGAAITEANVKVLTDAKTLDKGHEVYTANCVSCHGQNGEGGVGPNLTDEYWIHGNTIQNVFKTLEYGVPQKGMIAWKGKLKPFEMQAVANYLLSLEGTKPANPKAPQGIKMAKAK